MFSFEHILTKEFVLARVSQEEIFSRYMGSHPKIGERFVNPLPGRSKPDQHPDCVYFYSDSGKLMFKDWAFTPGSGVSAWDCFAVVQQYYGCGYYQALQHIVDDFGLAPAGTPVPAKRDYSYQVPSAKQISTPQSYVPIQVKRKSWSDQELQYWQIPDRVVTVEELERARIYPLSHWWWDSWLMGYNTNMCFGYFLGLPDKWQIYQPLSRDKRYKFRQSSSSWIHGISSASKEKGYIIITKSIADRVYLTLAGYNAVNVLSESHRFNQDQVDELNQYGTVVILYDSDSVGVQCAQERSEENGWKYIEYDPVFANDTKEAMKKHGMQKTKEIIDAELKRIGL